MKVKNETNRLEALKRIGQSPWYDNIERRLIKNGELKKLFEDGILGVTSNPTIFEKAVSGSDEYDGEIKKLFGIKKDAFEIYDGLTMEDVSAAADLLRDTYERTNRLDGYVSIEVLPEYAHNPGKTIEDARRIFNKIKKPNVMIKVPGTEKGCEAIRTLIKDGINVNATLLFSVGHYENAALSYIEGLNDRLKDGKDIKNIFSVASIFVSRVDTKADKILEEKKNDELKGKIAVANTKMIYQRYKEIFAGKEFRSLESKGANIQRALWASTSTKNPAYRDVKYVEELIGPHTINTMPPATIDAFLDHGNTELTIEKNLDEAKSDLAGLKRLGIDLETACQEIQDAGLKAFQDSFDKLIQSIKNKML